MSGVEAPNDSVMDEEEQEVIDQFDEGILGSFEEEAQNVVSEEEVHAEEPLEYSEVMESEEVVTSEGVEETALPAVEEEQAASEEIKVSELEEAIGPENNGVAEKLTTVSETKTLDECASKEDKQAAEPSESEPQEAKTSNAVNSEEKNDESASSKNTPASLRRSSRGAVKSPAGGTPGENGSSGRTTRSQNNPGILAKQKSFIQKYQIAVKGPMEEYTRSTVASESDAKPEVNSQGIKRKWEDSGGDSTASATTPVQDTSEKKTKRSAASAVRSGAVLLGHFLAETDGRTSTVERHDRYCWMCHMDGQTLNCSVCPRAFHQRCIQQQAPPANNWVCPECVSIRNAEKSVRVNGEQLAMMLGFALERIKSVADSQPFFTPVDLDQFPHYPEYIVYPMDIGMLEERVQERVYKSTRAFMADCRWILHNCAVFNTPQAKLTAVAKTVMKVCRHEMGEIDTCPDCYVHAHTKRDTWFVEPCRRPHLLLWAKLKGFPHWPAKAMKANKEGNVDVRFFGAHDRAWVPVKDCFLYSEEMPAASRNKRKANLDSSVKEVERHIKKLAEKFGEFRYAPPRTVYNPQKEEEQLLILVPNYKPREEAAAQTPPKKTKAAIQNKPKEPEPEPAEPEPAEPKPPEPKPVDPEPAEPEPIPEPVPPAPVEEDKTEATAIRGDDCSFLAMLQLAPRAPASSADPNSPGSGARPPVRNQKKLRSKTITTDAGVPKTTPKAIAPPKVPPPQRIEPRRILPKPTQESNNNEASGSTESSSVKMEPVEKETSQETIQADKSDTDVSVAVPVTVAVVDREPETPMEEDIENVEKAASSPNPATGTQAEEEEDLDPAMYLDPTITITLVNNEGEKIKTPTKNAAMENTISTSDLQALSALGENVSITVVPRKKDVQTKLLAIKPKEGENQPGALESDSSATAGNKSRTIPQGKARKSIQKARPLAQAKPKLSTPPMVAIASKQLNIESVAKRTLQPAPAVPRVPSITVRPVAHLPSSQPSIILQTGGAPAVSAGAADLSAAQVGMVAVKNITTSTSNTPPASGALTLGAVQTLSADPSFGTSGLILTFNRPLNALPQVTTAAPSVKEASASLGTVLAAKSQQLADLMKNSIEALLQELGSSGSYEALAIQARLELERLRWSHQQEIEELKRSHERQLGDLRSAAEVEKQQKLAELRKQLEADKQRAVDEAKKKQWCAQCGQEAIFYCCWNTAYCDYPCQQAHWPKHMATCANANQNAVSETSETTGKSSKTSTSSAQQQQQLADVPVAMDEEKCDVHPALLSAGVATKTPRLRRKRCGTCAGCLVTSSCGECVNCRSVNSHRVCKKRICTALLENQSAQPTTPPPSSTAAAAPLPPSPQNNVVNGSSGLKKIAKSGSTQPKSDLGYTVIPSPDVTLTLTNTPSSQIATRLVVPTVPQQVISTAAPVTLLVSRPSVTPAEAAQPVSLSLPIVQCVQSVESRTAEKQPSV